VHSDCRRWRTARRRPGGTEAPARRC
jgi:hypothetical protein